MRKMQWPHSIHKRRSGCYTLDSCEIGATHTKDGVSWGHSGLSGPLGGGYPVLLSPSYFLLGKYTTLEIQGGTTFRGPNLTAPRLYRAGMWAVQWRA